MNSRMSLAWTPASVATPIAKATMRVASAAILAMLNLAQIQQCTLNVKGDLSSQEEGRQEAEARNQGIKLKIKEAGTSLMNSRMSLA
jgi:hypothetical protein